MAPGIFVRGFLLSAHAESCANRIYGDVPKRDGKVDEMSAIKLPVLSATTTETKTVLQTEDTSNEAISIAMKQAMEKSGKAPKATKDAKVTTKAKAKAAAPPVPTPAPAPAPSPVPAPAVPISALERKMVSVIRKVVDAVRPIGAFVERTGETSLVIYSAIPWGDKRSDADLRSDFRWAIEDRLDPNIWMNAGMKVRIQGAEAQLLLTFSAESILAL